MWEKMRKKTGGSSQLKDNAITSLSGTAALWKRIRLLQRQGRDTEGVRKKEEREEGRECFLSLILYPFFYCLRLMHQNRSPCSFPGLPVLLPVFPPLIEINFEA
jgi:hypothetical protein